MVIMSYTIHGYVYTKKQNYIGSLFRLFCFCLLPHRVLASVYGQGNYGGCGYSSCPSTSTGGTEAPPPTPVEVTLPSGLEVSINVAEGKRFRTVDIRLL